MRAWIKACKSERESRIVIPEGNHVMGMVGLEGPCKSDEIHVQIDGYIRTPPTGLRGLSWITFSSLGNLTVYGNGTLDGQGPLASKASNNRKNMPHLPLATNLRFESITNAIIQGLTSKDSRNFHIDVSRSMNVTLRRLTVTAPLDSNTTVGIFLRRSHLVTISDATIQTGHYCIHLSDGSQEVNIHNMTCGPGGGGGVLLGTLGRSPDEEKVFDVAVGNSSFISTANGLRIEAVPGTINVASNISFDDITMDKVNNPITIDQHFCQDKSCDKMEGKVKIKDVSFKNIKGSCASPLAIDISCYNPWFCKNVQFTDVKLKPSSQNLGPLKFQCTNVKIIKKGLVSPANECQ